MESADQGKLFVGGLSWETTEEHLREHFQQYGDIVEAMIMKDRNTGRTRGFGFICFADPAAADAALHEKHTINNRVVEAKKAVPRDEQQIVTRSSNGGQSPGGQGRTKKIFVGGLASTITGEEFRRYFEQFGTISDAVVMYDHETQRPRGFGFVTYDAEESADKVLQKAFHELNDKMVEVKAAVPREMSPASKTASGGGPADRGRYAGYSQAYPGYGRPDAANYGAMAAARGAYPYAYGNAPYAMNGSYPGGYAAAAAAGPGYGGAAGYGAYGGGPAGYSNANSGYGNSPGRTAWSGAGAGGYGGQAGAGYAAAAGGYGTGMWGFAGQAAGNSYGGGYYGNENGYAAGYGARENVYGGGSTGNYGTGAEAGTGSGYAAGYNGGYGADAYGAQGYQDRFRSEDGSADIPTSEGGYAGGYGASKQTQRGADARFRPYPDRT